MQNKSRDGRAGSNCWLSTVVVRLVVQHYRCCGCHCSTRTQSAIQDTTAVIRVEAVAAATRNTGAVTGRLSGGAGGWPAGFAFSGVVFTGWRSAEFDLVTGHSGCTQSLGQSAGSDLWSVSLILTAIKILPRCHNRSGQPQVRPMLFLDFIQFELQPLIRSALSYSARTGVAGAFFWRLIGNFLHV